jgi:hypothetical protein
MSNVINYDFTAKPKPPVETLEEVLRAAVLKTFNEAGVSATVTEQVTAVVVTHTMAHLQKLNELRTLSNSIQISGVHTPEEAVRLTIEQMNRQIEEWARNVFNTAEQMIVISASNACTAAVLAMKHG